MKGTRAVLLVLVAALVGCGPVVATLIVAGAAGGGSALSAGHHTSQGSPSPQLVFTSQPATTEAGTPLTFEVLILDGLLPQRSNVPVTVSVYGFNVLTNAPIATTGSLSVTLTGGVPYPGWSLASGEVRIDTPAQHASLLATAPGYVGVFSEPFDVTPPPTSGWEQRTLGLRQYAIVGNLAVSPLDPRTLYAAEQYGPVFVSKDASGSWNQATTASMSSPGTVVAVATDPTATNTLWLGSGFEVAKSTDGGASFKPALSVLGGQITSIVVDPSSPSTVYAGGSKDYTAAPGVGVWKTTDGGVTWAAVGTGLLDQVSVRALAIDRTTPSSLYVAAVSAGVLRSRDAGASWAFANSGLDPQAYVECIAALASNVFIGTSKGVYKSADGATSWAAANAGLPTSAIVVAIAIDPTDANVVYAGTFLNGIWKTRSGGTTWFTASFALTPGYEVTSLAIDPTRTTTVYAIVGGAPYRSLTGGE